MTGSVRVKAIIFEIPDLFVAVFSDTATSHGILRLVLHCTEFKASHIVWCALKFLFYWHNLLLVYFIDPIIWIFLYILVNIYFFIVNTLVVGLCPNIITAMIPWKYCHKNYCKTVFIAWSILVIKTVLVSILLCPHTMVVIRIYASKVNICRWTMFWNSDWGSEATLLYLSKVVC